MFDRIVKGGFIVSETGVSKQNIVIDKSKIVAITSPDVILEAKDYVDASDMYIFPGLIDGHMHCQAPFQGIIGQVTFKEQSVAAAYGGVTTYIDFANTMSGDSVVSKCKERIEEMSPSAVDYSVHGKFVNPNTETIYEIPELINLGIPSFKMFMTYSKEKVMTNDQTLFQIFKASSKYNCLPMIHAESDSIAEYNFNSAYQDDDFSWQKFSQCKPIYCELEAFQKAVLMAASANSKLMIVHTTNKECFDYAEKYQKLGHEIYVETCPHYLTLFDELYRDPEKGHLAMCSPPLRTSKQADEIWDAIANGIVQLTGSDDCTFTKKEKEKFLNRDEKGNLIQDFRKVVNGISGIELRLPILLTEGFHKHKASLEKICSIAATQPAKIYGLIHRKGEIKVGLDADLSIVDINKEWIVSIDKLHSGVDYSLFDGYRAKGKVISTILRGEFILENEKFVGKFGNGLFIQRKIGKSYE